MKKGLISIIVPCYNVSAWLDDCFKGLENQTYKSIEVIFVNDGSKDDTLEKLTKFCENKQNFKIINQKNSGVSEARNRGIASSQGEFLYFLDADDIMKPNLLEKLHDLLLKTEADCSICKYELVSEEFHFDNIHYEETKKEEVFCDRTKILKLFINYKKFGHAVWSNLYRKDIMQKIAGFPNVFQTSIDYGEDVDFNFKYLANCNKVALTQDKLYLYRQRNSSAMHKEFSTKKLSTFQSYDNAIELCVGDLKSVKHTVVLRKFDRYLMYFNEMIRDKFKDKQTIKKLFKDFKKTIWQTCHPILFTLYLYYKIRLF